MSTKPQVVRSVTVFVVAPLSALAALVLAAAVALGGSLDVNASAAFPPTSFGLEVTPTTCFGQADLVIPAGTVSGPRTGCETITATNVTVDSAAIFTAGRSIALGDGFSVASGATFSAGIDPSASQFPHVVDSSPAGETTYLAELRIHPHNVALATSNELEIITGFSPSGEKAFRVVLLDGDQVRADARLDNGTWIEGSTCPLSMGAWTRLALDYRAGNGDGHLMLGVDGPARAAGLSSLTNSSRTVDSVSLGAVDALNGVISSVTGSFYLDEFSSFR